MTTAGHRHSGKAVCVPQGGVQAVAAMLSSHHPLFCAHCSVVFVASREPVVQGAISVNITCAAPARVNEETMWQKRPPQAETRETTVRASYTRAQPWPRWYAASAARPAAPLGFFAMCARPCEGRGALPIRPRPRRTPPRSSVLSPLVAPRKINAVSAVLHVVRGLTDRRDASAGGDQVCNCGRWRRRQDLPADLIHDECVPGAFAAQCLDLRVRLEGGGQGRQLSAQTPRPAANPARRRTTSRLCSTTTRRM